MNIEETRTLETATSRRRRFFLGGFGYSQKRDGRVTAALGHDTIPALPDAVRVKGANRFTITNKNGEQQVSWRDAMRRLHSNDEVVSSVSEFQVQRMQQIADHLHEHSPDSPADLVAQSADVAAAILLAEAHPEMIGNMVLVNPAGVVRQPQFLQAAAGVLLSVMRSKKEKRSDQSEVFETSRQRRRDRKLGGFAMACSVALSDQVDILRSVRTRRNAPKIAMILGLNDPMIRPSRVVESIIASDVDILYINNATHGVNGRVAAIDEIQMLLDDLDGQAADSAMSRTKLTDKIRFADDVRVADRETILAIARRRDELGLAA